MEAIEILSLGMASVNLLHCTFAFSILSWMEVSEKSREGD